MTTFSDRSLHKWNFQSSFVALQHNCCEGVSLSNVSPKLGHQESTILHGSKHRNFWMNQISDVSFKVIIFRDNKLLLNLFLDESFLVPTLSLVALLKKMPNLVQMSTNIISRGYEKVIYIMRWRIAEKDSQASLKMASESKGRMTGIFPCGTGL